MTEKLLPSAEFSLTKKTTQIEGAYEDFAKKLHDTSVEELEAMGIRDVEKDGDSIRFTALSGHVDIGNIPYGTYTLKEEKAPEGYLSLNGKAEFEFTLSADQKNAKLNEDNQVVNDRAQFVIKLKKTDNLKRSISGISFISWDLVSMRITEFYPYSESNGSTPCRMPEMAPLLRGKTVL